MVSKIDSRMHSKPAGIAGIRSFFWNGDERTLLLWLILFAFLVRLLAWLVVSRNEVAPLFDEGDYLLRAKTWADILDAWLSGTAPGQDFWDTAYGEGIWPPLHSMLLGIVHLLFGPSPAAARFLMVVLSTLTIPLLFRLTKDFLGRESAVSAVLLYAIYPTFIAYSHFLWSETTYIFFYVCSVYLIVRMQQETENHRLVIMAVLAGFCLGLAGLTRAIVLLSLVALPVFMMASFHGSAVKRWIVPLLYAGVAMLLLLPWQKTLSEREGEFLLLSSRSGYNLYIGNNPWAPAAYGSSWGDLDSMQRVKQAIWERMNRDGVSREAAAKELAKEEIFNHPGRFLLRTLARARMLLTFDIFSLRHLYHGVYPPVWPVVAGLGAMLLIVFNLLYFSFMTTGAVLAPTGIFGRALLFTAAITHIAPALATVAIPRIFLPVQVLLLPFAGWALWRATRTFSWRFWGVMASCALFYLYIVLTTFPLAAKSYFGTSSYYRSAVFGQADTFGDAVMIEVDDVPGAKGGDVAILTPGYSFREKGQTRRPFSLQERQGIARIYIICAEKPEAPLSMAVTYRGVDKRVEFSPISRAAWQKKLQSSDPGVKYSWLGGSLACK